MPSPTSSAWWHKLGRLRPRTPPLAELFAQFQTVLAAKNRVMEMITELGDKLGGDYLFDSAYTAQAYSDLRAALTEALHAFAILTDNRYPELAQVLARIDGLVQQVLRATAATGDRPILFPAEISWDLATAVGGKNYQLAVLKNELHLLVPDFFAISTTSFSDYLQHNNLQPQFARANEADPPDRELALAALRQAIQEGKLPDSLAKALATAVRIMRRKVGNQCRLAVRSSAEEEDGFHSFAGQFETVLNVACQEEAVAAAYRQVIASLFQANAVAYQRNLGYELGRMRMAVACVAMVAAKVSGVIYTVAAAEEEETLLISAAWGLGLAVVDGLTDPDLYTVHKGEVPRILSSYLGEKELMVAPSAAGGTETVATPLQLRDQPCLSEPQVLELTRQAMAIESFYKEPQDIEWAIDEQGNCYFLQTRGLRWHAPLPDTQPHPRPALTDTLPVLLDRQGLVIHAGITAGRVFIPAPGADLGRVPKGAILVARHDSPAFVQAIPFINAIITDLGTPTSHMASICREFMIPTVVNAANATNLLRHGQEVTLVADGDEGGTVYLGVADTLLRQQRQSTHTMRDLYEYRRQKYIMHYIAPLNLVNPLAEEFTPARCRTVHDLIRFIHELAVQTLVTNASRQGHGLLGFFGQRRGIRRLQIAVPIELLLIDIGGGIVAGSGGEVTSAELTSIPLLAILQGMTHPGVWQRQTMRLQGLDLLTSMTRTVDLNQAGATAGANLAVISGEYVNLSLRFGYHFSMLDCLCGELRRNNHILFRFVGGAATLTSRSLRLRLLTAVLIEFGFAIKTSGDLLVARRGDLEQTETQRLLNQLGRLLAYARQLDAQLTSEAEADHLAKQFLLGDYRGQK